MEPYLRGLAILYATILAWSIFFAVWGFLAALATRAPRVVAAIFVGPRLFGFHLRNAEFVVRAIPWPFGGIFTAPLDEAASDDEPAPPPFGELSLLGRAIVLLGPFVVLVLLIVGLAGSAALARLPHDLTNLVRGALAPLTLGADLAGGFLRRLGEVPLPEATGLALRKQLAVSLLPLWGGLWSTLLFVAGADPGRSRPLGRIAVAGTLAYLLLALLWIVAIGRTIVG